MYKNGLNNYLYLFSKGEIKMRIKDIIKEKEEMQKEIRTIDKGITGKNSFNTTINCKIIKSIKKDNNEEIKNE